MAFEITNSPKRPIHRIDFDGIDREINFNNILNYINSIIPETASIAKDIEFDEETLKIKVEANTPYSGTLSYKWAVSATEDGTYTDIAGATSAEYTCTSSESEKYIGVKISNTLNGVANTTLFKYGKLPVIS